VKRPHRTALPAAWPAPDHASGATEETDAAPELPARPVIQITITVVLPVQLAWLLTAAGALLQALRHGR
jgi:hypothetical protein